MTIVQGKSYQLGDTTNKNNYGMEAESEGERKKKWKEQKTCGDVTTAIKRQEVRNEERAPPGRRLSFWGMSFHSPSPLYLYLSFDLSLNLLLLFSIRSPCLFSFQPGI